MKQQVKIGEVVRVTVQTDGHGHYIKGPGASAFVHTVAAVYMEPNLDGSTNVRLSSGDLVAVKRGERGLYTVR